jgi:hypothetical protein
MLKMSLQQLPPKKRILFLIEFVAEIVTHSAEDERLKKLIKVERIKRKLVPEPPVDLSPIGKSIIFEQEFQKSKPIKPVNQVFHRKQPPRKIYKTPGETITKNIRHSLMGHEIRPNEEVIADLNKIINDKNVQMIECPGPGRNILVKVKNDVNLTKLILNEAEIKNVIIYFSDYARIPIVGGILKTSIESMMISAVVSDYAGSRFIINKRSPYDLIKNM